MAVSRFHRYLDPVLSTTGDGSDHQVASLASHSAQVLGLPVRTCGKPSRAAGGHAMSTARTGPSPTYSRRDRWSVRGAALCESPPEVPKSSADGDEGGIW